MLLDVRLSPRSIIPLTVVVFIQVFLFSAFRWHLQSPDAPAFPASHHTTPETLHDKFPSDYRVKSESDQWCEDTFGPSYLAKLAVKQQPYCESESPSRLQCFQHPRHDSMWKSDSFCIAQGLYIPRQDVSLDRGRNASFECRLRNFTAERAAGNKGVEGVQDLKDMHSYFYWNGVREETDTWKINPGPRFGDCSAESGVEEKPDWIMLVKREDNGNVWHKLMEIWQVTITLDVLKMASDPVTGIPYLTPEEANNLTIVWEDDRTEYLDDVWRIVNGKTPIRKSAMQPGCYGNVVLPLPGSSSPFWLLLVEHLYHPVCESRFLLNTFLRRIYSHFNITPRFKLTGKPVITIIDRQQTRKIYNINGMTENLRKKYPDHTIHLVDFATLSLREQIVLVQSTDVLIGHHGAGMTHVMFLPEESAVVEILPPTFSMLGFRQIGKMRGLQYFTEHSVWVGDWERERQGQSEFGENPMNEDGWQLEEWAYVREKDFEALVDAALRSQYNRALPYGEGGQRW